MMNMIAQSILWLVLTGNLTCPAGVCTLLVEVVVCLVEARFLVKVLLGRVTVSEALLFSPVLNADCFGVW
jgi:hypothetical protein